MKLVLLTLAATLGGCSLYSGKSQNDQWTYCDSGGQYQCTGDNCTWVSPTCTTGSGSGSGSGNGYNCTTNNDCATGCYCGSDGLCNEGGFCKTDADCGPGFHCDTNRSSCEPTTATCAGDYATTCTNTPPQCPAGQVPLLDMGCANGSCVDYASCNLPPVCSHINDETNCLNRSDCSGVYDGIDCTKPGGGACHTGDTDCTCQSFVFAACAAKSN